MTQHSPSSTSQTTERSSPPAFSAFLQLPHQSGEGRVLVGKDALVLDSLFFQCALPYEEILSFSPLAGGLEIQVAAGAHTLARMGQSAQWLYQALWNAYNRRVLQALGVEGGPLFETEGHYAYGEGANQCRGRAKIQLFSDCLCLLPPSREGRRIPLRFLCECKRETHTIVFVLQTGERYALLGLGRDMDPLERQLADCLCALREESATQAGEIEPSLSPAQRVLAAQLLPKGVSAPLKKVAAVLPSLAKAVEQLLSTGKMAETYPLLCELCGSQQEWVGILPAPPVETNPLAASLPAPPELPQLIRFSPSPIDDAPAGEEGEPSSCPWILWSIFPSPNRTLAVVEFAIPGEDTATYLFHTGGNWKSFLPLLARGLEAAGLRREIFSLSNEELSASPNELSRMAVQRTPPLEELRHRFAGRVIHRTPASWRCQLERLFAASPEIRETRQPTNSVPAHRFCGRCGAPLTQGRLFCGHCGEKLT